VDQEGEVDWLSPATRGGLADLLREPATDRDGTADRTPPS
jgi:hypothetical protein